MSGRLSGSSGNFSIMTLRGIGGNILPAIVITFLGGGLGGSGGNSRITNASGSGGGLGT